MADFEIQVLEIKSASISPNPVNVGNKFVLSVKITEKTNVLEPVYFYANEIYSGENDGN